MDCRWRPRFCEAASATFARICFSIVAYGRAAIARSCALRSFAAETIFMALVICCVFLTRAYAPPDVD